MIDQPGSHLTGAVVRLCITLLAVGGIAAASSATVPGGAVDATLSDAGDRIAVAHGDRHLRLWDTASGELVGDWRAHGICASAVAWGPADERLASGGWDGRVVLWDPATGTRQAEAVVTQGIVIDLYWVGDTHLVALVSDGAQRRVLAIDAATLAPLRDGAPLAGREIAFSPDARTMATIEQIDAPGTPRRVELVLTDTLDGEEIRRFAIAWDRLSGIVFTPDGERLAVSGSASGIGTGSALYRLADGERLWLATAERGEPRLRLVAASADGSRLAGFSRRRGLAFLDIADGAPWIGAAQAQRMAEAAQAAERDPDSAHVPWHPFAGLERGWVGVAGATVYAVADGALAPQAWHIDSAEPAQRFLAPEPPTRALPSPTGADRAFTERFAAPMDADRYTLETERDTFFWVDGQRRSGLHFNVRGDIKDLMARDYLQRAWPVGTRPFEVRCEYVMPVNKVWQAAAGHAGWWVGLSSGPVESLAEDDLTVLINVHPKGFFAGVVGGPPFAYHAPADEVLARSLLTPDGLAFATPASTDLAVARDEVDSTAAHLVQGYQVQLRGGAGRRDIERTLRIVRTADDELVFAVHEGRRLHNAKPLWSMRWPLPEDLARVPLDHLIVKRVPIPNHHPGWAMQGRITALTTTLDPPSCRSFAYLAGSEILRRGAVIEVTGAGFDPACQVEVGGEAAAVEVVDSGTLRVTLPDLAEGRSYDLCVSNPDGAWSFLPESLPFGRMLTGVEPSASLPAGGREVAVVGAGFAADTEILFGDTAVPVSEVLSPTRAVVTVPPGAEGSVTLTARTDSDAHAGTAEFGYAAHPFLFYTADTVSDLRDKFADPLYAEYQERILRSGDRVEPVLSDDGGGKHLRPLVGAWVCTGEDRYKDQALILIDRIIAELDRFTFGRMNLASSMEVAIAYDALFAEMSQEQRHGLQEYLRRSIAAHMRGIPEENDDDNGRSKPRAEWHYTNIGSANAVCNAGAGMASLALRHSSAMARKDLRYAIRYIRRYAEEGVQADGANVEGSFFASYGGRRYFAFAEALAHALDDTQLLDMPHFQRYQEWYLNMLGGNGRFYMINDTYPLLSRSHHFASLARHLDQDFMRYMADRHGDHGYLDLLFRDDRPAPEACPPIPTLHVFDATSITTLRSGPEPDARLTVCIKGNDGANSHHNHTDIGHLIMILDGEQILSDDGIVRPSRGENHSILMLDGEPPDATGGWITDSWEHGPWRAVVMDMRVAYMGLAQRIRRHYVMYDDQGLVLLDDVVPDDDREGIVTSYFQAGGEVDLGEDGASATIRGRTARLHLRSSGPEIGFASGRGRGAEGTIRNPIWGSYQADPDRPMVTTLLAGSDSADTPPEAVVTREDDAIAVTFPDGESILFKRTDAGWAFITKDEEARPLLSTAERNTEIPDGAKTIGAGFFDQAPRIDGLLGDAAWKDAAVAYDFKVVTGELPADQPGQVRFGYDEEHLYLGITCLDDDLPGVWADVTQRDGPINRDDSVEIFIDTNLDRKTYFQFMINANGVLYDGFGWSARWDADAIEVATGLSPERDAWLLEIAIPWSTLEIPPPGGETPLPMGLQIARNSQDPEELSHWAPTGTHNNHMPWMYGVLVFDE